MNTQKGYLTITIVLSIISLIVGMLMLIFSDSADEKTVGLAMAVIGPAVIWGVYGCAFFPFKGFSVLKSFRDKPRELPHSLEQLI